MRKTSLLGALCAVWLLVAPVLADADGELSVTTAANKPRKKARAARKKKPAKPAKEAAPATKTSARTVQIQIRTGNKPMRFVSVSRMIDGKALQIQRRDNGPIVVTRTEGGKTITRKLKNPDELCKQDAEAYKLYKSIGTSAKGISSHVVVGTSVDVKVPAAKAKAAAERCRKEAEVKRRQIEEQFEARRKAYEHMHEQRLKQLDQMRARTREQFERALRSIEEQIKQEQQRHRAAMEQLERMQKELK